METSPRHQKTPIPQLLPSPNSHSSNSSSSGTSGTTANHNNHHHHHHTPPPPPPPPKPITRSESANPYPTTFVQADTCSFKQVVQMLTGSPKPAAATAAAPTTPQSDLPSKTHIPPIKSNPKKQSGFKLYERRNSLKNLKLNPLIPVFASNQSSFSPRKPEILSPSILDFPSLVLSPVTPLIPDPFDRSGVSNFRCSSEKNLSVDLDTKAEEKAIAEKGFYFHPSPATTPRESEPRLLPLFPVTSPRVPGSTSTPTS